ncbi:MAG: hypothetical protein Q9P01_05680 [Anaerolineae bacterium]|nr:hypothetical protein [Anaerolineae bacterium]
MQLQLEISNVDRYQQSAAEIIVGMVDSIQVNNIGVQPYPVSYPWGPFQQPIDTVTDIDFQFPIFDNVLRLIAVKAFIIRDVWTAVAGVAEAGGDHKHLVAKLITTTFFYPPVTVNPSTHVGTATLTQAKYRYATDDDPQSGATFDMNVLVGSGAQGDWYTNGASGTHTHTTKFDKVKKDNVKPEDCTLKVNGVVVSSNLFPNSGGSDIEEIDITNEVLNKTGGFRAWHDVNIACGTNRGDISVVFFIDVEVATVRT